MKKRFFEKRRILWLLFTLFFLWTAEDVTLMSVEAAGTDASVILRESEDGGRRRDDEEEDKEDDDGAADANAPLKRTTRTKKRLSFRGFPF